MVTSGTIKARAKKGLSGKWMQVAVIMIFIGIAGVAINLVVTAIRAPYVEKGDILWRRIVEAAGNGTSDGGAVTAYVANQMILYAINLLGLIGRIYTWFFMLPAVSYCIGISAGEGGEFKNFSKKFNRAGESFRLYISIYIRVFLWSLLFIIPGIIKSLAYMLAPMIKEKNPQRKAGECIAESVRLMNGNKASAFVFYISFIGWYILIGLAQIGAGAIPVIGRYLGVIVAFVAGSVLDAYILMSEIMFYEEIVRPTRYAPPAVTKSEVFEELRPDTEVFEELKKKPDIFGDFYDEPKPQEEVKEGTDVEKRQEKEERHDG